MPFFAGIVPRGRVGTSAGQRGLDCNTVPLLSRPHASSPSSARTRRRAIRGTVGTDRLLADRYSWGTLLGPSREDPPLRRRLAALTRSIASITFSACARTRIVGAAALRLCEPAGRALDSRLRPSRSGHYRSPTSLWCCAAMWESRPATCRSICKQELRLSVRMSG